MSEKIEAILNAAEELIQDREGPRTPCEARLALALHDYDARRFCLGAKDYCSCSDKDGCDECMTEAEALAIVRRMAASDQPST